MKYEKLETYENSKFWALKVEFESGRLRVLIRRLVSLTVEEEIFRVLKIFLAWPGFELGPRYERARPKSRDFGLGSFKPI